MSNRTMIQRPNDERPIVKVAIAVLVVAMGWWFADGFWARRDIEAEQRAAIIRAEGGMSQ